MPLKKKKYKNAYAIQLQKKYCNKQKIVLNSSSTNDKIFSVLLLLTHL